MVTCCKDLKWKKNLNKFPFTFTNIFICTDFVFQRKPNNIENYVRLFFFAKKQKKKRICLFIYGILIFMCNFLFLFSFSALRLQLQFQSFSFCWILIFIHLTHSRLVSSFNSRKIINNTKILEHEVQVVFPLYECVCMYVIVFCCYENGFSRPSSIEIS